MLELLTIRIGLGELLPLTIVFDKQLQVIAIRADHCDCELGGFVTGCPVERGLENNLFFGVTLRLVESRRWLWLAEDIANAVIADAVARTEIIMRVVIECAPADATR